MDDDERSDKTEWRSASCRREGETREGPADCGQASGRDTQRPRCSVERLGDLMPVHTGLACHGWWVGLDGGETSGLGGHCRWVGLRWDAMDVEDGGAIVDEWA